MSGREGIGVRCWNLGVIWEGGLGGGVGLRHANVYLWQYWTRSFQKVGTFFFSIAFVSIRYIPPRITISRMAPIQIDCFFWEALFSLAYIYARYSYSFLRCFYSRCTRYSSSRCLTFYSYFYRLRTARYSTRLFYSSASPTLAFSNPARMASMVCPFLLRSEGSHPKFFPAAYSFIVMVW